MSSPAIKINSDLTWLSATESALAVPSCCFCHTYFILMFLYLFLKCSFIISFLYPTTRTASSTMPLRLSRLCSSKVLLATLSNGFGLVIVKGQVLVDFPAASITACILENFNFYGFAPFFHKFSFYGIFQ